MKMWKVIILLLIVSSSLLEVDGRARRKRRQYSSASYYLTGALPYAHPNVDPGSLTYPSGSFYDAPGYGYTNPAYDQNLNYNMNQYNTGMNQYAQQYPYNNFYSSNTQMGMIPGTFSDLYGYGPGGFNNRNPDWNQGNSLQYYTGGSGNGLSNSYTTWLRSLRMGPFQGRPNGLPAPAGKFDGNAMGPNPFMPIRQPPPMGPPSSPGK